MLINYLPYHFDFKRITNGRKIEVGQSVYLLRDTMILNKATVICGELAEVHPTRIAISIPKSSHGVWVVETKETLRKTIQGGAQKDRQLKHHFKRDGGALFLYTGEGTLPEIEPGLVYLLARLYLTDN